MKVMVPRDHETLLSVCEYGIELGEIVTATDALRFFEKPERMVYLYDLWYHRNDPRWEAEDE